MLIIYMMLLGPFVAWRSYLWLNRRIAHAAPVGSLNQRASLSGDSLVGADPVLLESAPADLVRTAEERGQRLVVMGDVHGCLKQREYAYSCLFYMGLFHTVRSIRVSFFQAHYLMIFTHIHLYIWFKNFSTCLSPSASSSKHPSAPSCKPIYSTICII